MCFFRASFVTVILTSLIFPSPTSPSVPYITQDRKPESTIAIMMPVKEASSEDSLFYNIPILTTAKSLVSCPAALVAMHL